LDEDKKGRGERKKGGNETGDKGDKGNRKREAGVWNREERKMEEGKVFPKFPGSIARANLDRT
jgi:hypothetical protein